MRLKRITDPRLRCPAAGMSTLLIALSGLFAGCAPTMQVDATPPTVTYRYEAGAEVETRDRAEDYCDRYGLEPHVASRDPDNRYITYACE
jgi:hypothetical protein